MNMSNDLTTGKYNSAAIISMENVKKDTDSSQRKGYKVTAVTIS